MLKDAPLASSAIAIDVGDARATTFRSDRATTATNDTAVTRAAPASLGARVGLRLICPTAHKVRNSRANVPPIRRSKESR
jgi:hypothetical protein